MAAKCPTSQLDIGKPTLYAVRGHLRCGAGIPPSQVLHDPAGGQERVRQQVGDGCGGGYRGPQSAGEDAQGKQGMYTKVPAVRPACHRETVNPNFVPVTVHARPLAALQIVPMLTPMFYANK